MPTHHRRHAITETDDIKDALEVARRAWPDLAHKPGALLRRLILAGQKTLAREETAVIDERRHAVEETSGALAGVFGTRYLDEVREDWPE
jgi:hypothetical protein